MVETAKRKIVYFLVFFSFFLVSLSLNVGLFQISIARMMYVILIAFFVIDFAIKGMKLQSYSTKFMLIWFFYAILQGVYAPIMAGSLVPWVKSVYFLSWFTVVPLIITKFIKKTDDVRFIFVLIQIAVFIQICIGIYEYSTGNYIFATVWTQEEIEYIHSYSRRYFPLASQSNPNDYAVVMMIGYFVSVACFRLFKNVFHKIFCITNCILSVWLINISLSRSSFIGLVIGIAFMLVTVKGISKKFIVLSMCLLGAILGVVLYGDVIMGLIRENVLSLTIEGESVRVGLVIDGIVAFFRTLGFGNGVVVIGRTPWHNWWIEVLASYGIFIFIGYIIFYIKTFRNLYRVKIASDDKKNTVIADSCCAIMAGLTVACMGPANSISLEWLGVVWGVIICFETIMIKQVIQPYNALTKLSGLLLAGKTKINELSV